MSVNRGWVLHAQHQGRRRISNSVKLGRIGPYEYVCTRIDHQSLWPDQCTIVSVDEQTVAFYAFLFDDKETLNLIAGSHDEMYVFANFGFQPEDSPVTQTKGFK